MTFRDILAEVMNWLQQDERLSYQALQRQFDLDDDYLEDLKVELIEVKQVAADQDHKMLVWTGGPLDRERDAPPETDGETRFHAALPAVIAFLQREGRVTYYTLKYIFSLDDALLDNIRRELALRQLAVDDQGQVLVWTGQVPAVPTSVIDVPSDSALSTISSPALPPSSVATETGLASKRSITLEDPLTTDVDSGGPTATAAPLRPAPDAERRQLTVMFCDLVGSTELSSKLDPEDLREVVRAYQEIAAKVIERYEGHIAQYLGDGLLIYFGWPQAHENDAERAVYTGLEIPVAIDRLNQRLDADHSVKLAVRMGIHTGPVVVGEMGGGERHENLALGETPNIAARLEGLAQANTTVMSPVTAQLVQGAFILEELGRHELKGVADPMMLYTAVAPREVDPDDYETMLAGGFDALVGRAEEIGLLLRRWQQSKEGQGQVVLISGEAGLGKSSLVEGLRTHVHEEGYPRIAFRCSPYTENSALHPVIEQAQRLLGWQREDAVETKLAKLEQRLASISQPCPSDQRA